MDSPSATPSAAAIQIMEKIPETLAKVIDTLSTKLGSTGEALFKILVKQQIVNGIQNVFEIAINAVILYLWWAWLYKKAVSMVDEDSDGPGVITVISIIVTVIIVIMTIVDFEQAVAYFINPQYYAIKDLMDMVR